MEGIRALVYQMYRGKDMEMFCEPLFQHGIIVVYQNKNIEKKQWNEVMTVFSIRVFPGVRIIC